MGYTTILVKHDEGQRCPAVTAGSRISIDGKDAGKIAAIEWDDVLERLRKLEEKEW